MDEILREIRAEVERAETLYHRFHSGHEGYAVLREEVEELRDLAEDQAPLTVPELRCPMCELWELIKTDKGVLCTEAMRKEAVQVAAMCVRFVENLS